eukprot:EG_transcript_13224
MRRARCDFGHFGSPPKPRQPFGWDESTEKLKFSEQEFDMGDTTDLLDPSPWLSFGGKGEMLDVLHQGVFVVGVLYLVKVVVGFVKFLQLGSGVNLSKCGKWAVVTGSTDGIGKEYALQLAAKGLNIVLLARNGDLLREVAQEIEEKYSVKTKVIQQDISTATPEDYERIAKEINILEDVGILVNNVGLSYQHPEFFDQVPIDTHRALLSINCNSMVELTHALLPAMIQRRKGVIINLCSISGLMPCPLLATYSATKAFVATFSDALNSEYKCKGITVQSCTPAFVVSKMSKIKRPSFFTPTPKAFVKSALSSVGAGPAVNLPYWPHRLQAAFITGLPDSLRDMYISSLHLKIRSAALRKKKEG